MNSDRSNVAIVASNKFFDYSKFPFVSRGVIMYLDNISNVDSLFISPSSMVKFL